MASMLKKLVGAVAVSALISGPAVSETLEEAIRAALATNPQLDIQSLQSDLAREGLAQARSAGRTTVDLSASGGYEYVDTNSALNFGIGDRPIASAQVQAVQPIYTGGRVRARIRQAEAGISSADSDFESARQDLYLNVVTAYVDVRRDRSTVDIRKNNVDVTGEQVRAAADRFEVGVVTRTDVSLAEARLEGARAALAGAEAALEASEANYEFLTSLNPGELAPPPPVPPLPANVDDAVARGLQNSPNIASAKYAERAASEAMNVAKAAGRPQVNIVGTAGVQETFGDLSRRDTNVSAVAQGRVPLLSGGLIKSQIRSARLQRDQARQQIDVLERQVRAQIAQAWFGYEASLRAIAASSRQVDAAQIAYEGAKEELAVGVRTTLDVLDQEQQLFEARLSLVQAERDSYVAAHRLLRATGDLGSVAGSSNLEVAAD